MLPGALDFPNICVYNSLSFMPSTATYPLHLWKGLTGSWPAETLFFQAPVPDNKTIALPVLQFGFVPATIAEYKQHCHMGDKSISCSTSADSPSKDLRMSTGSPYTTSLHGRNPGCLLHSANNYRQYLCQGMGREFQTGKNTFTEADVLMRFIIINLLQDTVLRFNRVCQ